MRVVAVRFPGPRQASALLDRLQRELHVDPPDVAIAPLGILGRATGDDTVLAGRFPEAKAVVLADLVREAGGEIVADVDERWTRPRSRRARALEREGRCPTRV
ncbi:hypothetical protein BH24CHL7_BH24CHL7_07530 [soil metagenome]